MKVGLSAEISSLNIYCAKDISEDTVSTIYQDEKKTTKINSCFLRVQ